MHINCLHSFFAINCRFEVERIKSGQTIAADFFESLLTFIFIGRKYRQDGYARFW